MRRIKQERKAFWGEWGGVLFAFLSFKIGTDQSKHVFINLLEDDKNDNDDDAKL